MRLRSGASRRRQRFVDGYILPDTLGHRLLTKYPGIAREGPAKRAFRQWLRIDILAPAQLAMPSRAVDLLWHEFLGTPTYPAFARRAFTGSQRHQMAKHPSARVAGTDIAMARTFAMACVDQGLDPRHPHELPDLFLVDELLHLPDAVRWILFCGHADCKVDDGVACVHHQLLPLIPARLPRQMRFHVPEHHLISDTELNVGPYANRW